MRPNRAATPATLEWCKVVQCGAKNCTTTTLYLGWCGVAVQMRSAVQVVQMGSAIVRGANA